MACSHLQELVTELHMQSIFTDVGKLSLQDPSHSAIIPSTTGQTGSPITATAWLSQSGEAHYALASPAGGITMVTLPPYGTQGRDDLSGVTGFERSIKCLKLIYLVPSGCL